LVIITKDGNVVVDNARTDVTNKSPSEAWNKWVNISQKEQVSDSEWEKITNEGTIRHTGHHHDLTYTNVDAKHSAYANGWACDECGGFNPPEVSNLWCKECDYDLCRKCLEIQK
jgi:hypothetical protein